MIVFSFFSSWTGQLELDYGLHDYELVSLSEWHLGTQYKVHDMVQGADMIWSCFWACTVRALLRSTLACSAGASLYCM